MSHRILYTDTDPDTIDTTQLQGAVIEYVGKGSVFGAERLAQLLRTTVERRTQSTYPVPQSETERLAALQSYDFDDAELAASLDQIQYLTKFGTDNRDRTRK
ncbi:MAG: GAF domain-containing protein, partial [Halovenus sp.]